MYSAFGIVNSNSKKIWVEGMQNYRSIGAFSFLGRFRIVDFPISNMTNSGIDRIQVYVDSKPRSLLEHLGTGRHYSINSKRGNLQTLFKKDEIGGNYNTDVAAYIENMEPIERMHNPYVVIAPSYMIYTQDFSDLIEKHIDSDADITMLYHSVDNAKDHFLSCRILNMNKQKGVLSTEINTGSAKNRNIFMDTYVMKKELFIELVKKAAKTSSVYTLADVINDSCSDLDIRGIAHHGYFAAITDFQSYYDASMSLIDYKIAKDLFKADWPIYTRTGDSCPTQYFPGASVKSSVVANECLIEGTVENSIIGRGCTIKKGAVIKNSVILSETVIGENVRIENQVIDKRVTVTKVKELIAPADAPGYIKRRDVI